MTYEDFKKLNFAVRGHLSMEDEHCLTYSTDDNKFGYCIHTPYKNGEPKGRAYIHYRIEQKVYKTKAKIIEALNNYENNK